MYRFGIVAQRLLRKSLRKAATLAGSPDTPIFYGVFKVWVGLASGRGQTMSTFIGMPAPRQI